MARRLALRPLRRLARRLLLQGLLRAPQPAMSLTTRRRRPRSIAVAAGNRVVVHRHQPRPAPLPPRSAPLSPRSTRHPQQQPPQQQQAQQQSSVTALEDDYMIAIRFVNLVKATLNSTEKFHTMLGILKEFREKLVREDPSPDLSETVRLVEELLQDHPQLIVAFR